MKSSGAGLLFWRSIVVAYLVLITDSVSLIVMSLFRSSISFWINLEILHVSKKYSSLLKWSESRSVMSSSGVGSRSFLQRIFPTQGSNPGLPHCRQSLYHLSHQGSPIKLEWVAYPFSRVPSRPRDWTAVSCIAGRFFTFQFIQFGGIYLIVHRDQL